MATTAAKEEFLVAETEQPASRANGVIEQVVEAVKEHEVVEAVSESEVVEKFNETMSPVVTPVVNGMRQTMLAGVGVVTLSYDQAVGLLNKAIERGEVTRKDAQGMLNERWEKMRHSNPPVERVAGDVERGVEGLLHWLNIPSKRDIDELSAKIDLLGARVEDLRKRK
jgi:poly(hydroxyalkanoate) granule-associated protein